MSIQLKEIKSTEWSFDINNQGSVVEALNDIKQCVSIICNTQKGTCVIRNNFGCDSFNYLDSPVNIAIPNIKKAIIDALTEFEPRIVKISVTSELYISNIIFTITYSIKNTILTDFYKATYGISNT